MAERDECVNGLDRLTAQVASNSATSRRPRRGPSFHVLVNHNDFVTVR
ncbi:MAG: hypothetical protein U0794_03505 [Isosphaeraceae bacterium]